jgi:prepilin-type N-terminal cleavage/methylation domain-containing protein
MIRGTSNHRLGVTLVEILVSLVILSIAIMLFGPFVDSLKTNRKAEEKTTALAYARNYLESLKTHWQTLEGYQTLSLATPQNPPETYKLEIKIENDEGGVIFSYPGGASSEDLSALRKLTVTFTDEEDRKMSFVTLMARPTPVPSEENNEE